MPEIWEGKQYKNTTSDNFEEYMKALGKCERNCTKKKVFKKKQVFDFERSVRCFVAVFVRVCSRVKKIIRNKM